MDSDNVVKHQRSTLDQIRLPDPSLLAANVNRAHTHTHTRTPAPAGSNSVLGSGLEDSEYSSFSVCYMRSV